MELSGKMWRFCFGWKKGFFMALSANWIEKLLVLRPWLEIGKVPERVLKAALADNPWFSEQDIARSMEALAGWLAEEQLREWLGRYPDPGLPPMRVGVIAAGNLPLVCLHDVLSVLVSGQHLWLKTARQDRALMEWLWGKWTEEVSEMRKIFHLSGQITGVEVLIATGSNNTARHIAAEYREIPLLMRKNRFSLGVIHPHTRQEELASLLEDIHSYQGLGCRNVSQVVLIGEDSKTVWEKSLRDNSKESLHPLYLERYLIERVRKQMLGEPFEDTGSLLRVPVKDLRPASMGVLHELLLPDLASWHILRQAHQDEIQCVVGEEVLFGKAQFPQLTDYADGVDTIAWLQSQQRKRPLA